MLRLRNLSRVLKMNGQAKISSFFSPQTAKRKYSSCSEQVEIRKNCSFREVENTPPKSRKIDENHTESSTKTLSPEQKTTIEQNRMLALSKLHASRTHGLVVDFGKSWLTALEMEFSKEYFVKLSKFVESERKSRTIFPPADQTFAWTNMCDIKEVKVVILGQDPYHGPRQAHGLCFSVQIGVPPPPSLLNIYKELEQDYEGFKHPGHGHLIGWARQGVLLLNAVLTVRSHEANSHKDKGWEQFTDAVISWLNKNTHGLVFILWGAYAQKKGAHIDKKKHHILKGVHPSPLSAHRGFFGCKHFSQCNSFLKKEGKEQIDWSHLPAE